MAGPSVDLKGGLHSPSHVITGLPLEDPNRGCMQAPIDPISKLPGLLDALKLMDAAVQQNNYLEKLLMYRDVRMPQHDQVNSQLFV